MLSYFQQIPSRDQGRTPRESESVRTRNTISAANRRKAMDGGGAIPTRIPLWDEVGAESSRTAANARTLRVRASQERTEPCDTQGWNERTSTDEATMPLSASNAVMTSESSVAASATTATVACGPSMSTSCLETDSRHVEAQWSQSRLRVAGMNGSFPIAARAAAIAGPTGQRLTTTSTASSR